MEAESVAAKPLGAKPLAAHRTPADAHRPPHRWTRRRALWLGGGAAAGAVFGLGAGAQSAQAAVPSSQRFELTEPSHGLFRHAALHDARVQQSFCFDNVNRRLFVAQLKDGTPDTAGDLCLTRLDFAGAVLGHMYLRGFGHGVSIAAQAVGSDTYLWTEVDANANGFGTRLARFRWSNGSTLSNTSAALTKHAPVSGARETTCAIDPVHQRMAVRYETGSGKRYAVFNVHEVAAGNYTNRLADLAQPGGLGVFQGYALHGQYVYQLDGTAYGTGNPEPGNTCVSSANVNTGALVQRSFTRAGSSLTYREPEGMAVYRTSGGETRLFLGFASGAAGDRRSNLFYKNVLV